MKAIAHNQTQRNHIEEADNRSTQLLALETGVAIFVVPDPEKGIDALKGVAVDGIHYEEAVKRAENCIMFKWVPHSAGSMKDYQDAKLMNAPCPGGRCYSTSDCTLGGTWCFCGGLGPIYTCTLY